LNIKDEEGTNLEMWALIINEGEFYYTKIAKFCNCRVNFENIYMFRAPIVRIPFKII
jgi:hypothetical protein